MQKSKAHVFSFSTIFSANKRSQQPVQILPTPTSTPKPEPVLTSSSSTSSSSASPSSDALSLAIATEDFNNRPSTPSPSSPPRKKPLIKKPLINPDQLCGKQRELYDLLDKFFTEEHLKDIIIPILSHKRPIRMRTLEYLVTTYAPIHNVQYRRDERDLTPWNLYESYRRELKFGNKKKVDMYKRGAKFPFRKGNSEITTSVSQLGFFRWAIQNKVIDWAMAHSEAIKKEMTRSKTSLTTTTHAPKKKKNFIANKSAPIILNVRIEVSLTT